MDLHKYFAWQEQFNFCTSNGINYVSDYIEKNINFNTVYKGCWFILKINKMEILIKMLNTLSQDVSSCNRWWYFYVPTHKNVTDI